MTTCVTCAKLGSASWQTEYESLKQITKNKKTKTGVSSVSLRRRIPVAAVPENVEVVESFGLQARRAREKLGLSCEELGRKIGEKASVIKKVESGSLTPDERLAAKLERALKLKLLVPVAEPETTLQSSSPPSTTVTLGEIVQLKSEKRRQSENEGDRGSQESFI